MFVQLLTAWPDVAICSLANIRQRRILHSISMDTGVRLVRA